MAEYIDRNKLNKKKKYLFQTQGMPFPKSEYFIKVDDFLSVPTADVIEREEYEKLKQKNIELEIEYDDVMKMNALRVTEYKQLRSEINKALEQTYKVREMVLHSNRTYEVNDVLDIIDEISACFERHIGE